MRAIDTNIVVRLVALDDDRQVALAKTVLAEPFIILPSVVLEATWVLSSSYAMPRDEIVDGLSAVFSNPNAVLASPQAIRSALAAFRKDGEFADHLHVALASEVGADVFATFDRKLGNRAASEVEIEMLG
jgi:predicted nucleic-acid-binding protein